MTTEEQILQTATKLFLEKGFAMTSTTEIAKEVGCNQALVHYYFRTKENLFMQVFMQKIRLFITAFTEKSAANEDFFERLERRICAHANMMEQNPNLPFLIMNELILNKERRCMIRDYIVENPMIRNIYYEFDKEIKEEIAKGVIRQIDTLDFLLNVLSLNVFIFVSAPIYTDLLDRTDKEKQAYISHRKEVVVKTLLNSLKP
ncbi:MAG: TetR/AcrR family transcriptional regulator [Bacteroidia bacterium]|nr:TetR/AcrR family transcriptional regulator [Bacteroidia bacterium]